jgi:hypothetical protein
VISVSSSERHLWRKDHIGIAETALKVRAIEITDIRTVHAPTRPELLTKILDDQEIGSVTAAGAYVTRRRHDAIAKDRFGRGLYHRGIVRSADLPAVRPDAGCQIRRRFQTAMYP